MGNKTYDLVNEVHEKYDPEVKYEEDSNNEDKKQINKIKNKKHFTIFDICKMFFYLS